MSKWRHFLDIKDLSYQDARNILDLAHKRKAASKKKEDTQELSGRTLAMVFDKPSTRTRVSFAVGIKQLGGEPLILSGKEMHLGESETIADTARVLSRFVDMIMMRTTGHDRVLEMAEFASVPVINGLTNDTHPCQIMADLMTIEEHLGDLSGKKIAWLGDGNNVLNSFMEAASLFGFEVSIATPKGCEPNSERVSLAQKQGATIHLHETPEDAVSGADVVVTDTWVSMGFEHEGDVETRFLPYQVNEAMMAHAKQSAIFMHCLPAHRGEEVTDAVMDGPQSVVFDEAENRLHVQKAIMLWCSGFSHIN